MHDQTANEWIGHPFWKMNGLGNDFVILDLRAGDKILTETDAAAIANRETGVGCDQIITLEKTPDKSAGPIFMGIRNADGSPAEACGNAARCVASLLFDETGKEKAVFDTPAGLVSARKVRSDVAVDMGEPRLDWASIPLAEPAEDTRFIDIKLGPIDAPVLWGPSAVNVGNPHCIFFVENVNDHAIERFGLMIEHHPLFPERANVSIAAVSSKHAIRLRVWERGVGMTKACGTAACAALVAANRRRLTARKATVSLDGGDLAIEWRDDNHIIMTGPATLEYEGELPATVFAAA